jgi:hypothetical protein
LDVLPDPMPITPDPASLVNRIASLPPLYRQRHHSIYYIHLNSKRSKVQRYNPPTAIFPRVARRLRVHATHHY